MVDFRFGMTCVSLMRRRFILAWRFINLSRCCRNHAPLRVELLSLFHLRPGVRGQLPWSRPKVGYCSTQCHSLEDSSGISTPAIPCSEETAVFLLWIWYHFWRSRQEGVDASPWRFKLSRHSTVTHRFRSLGHLPFEAQCYRRLKVKAQCRNNFRVLLVTSGGACYPVITYGFWTPVVQRQE